LILAPSRVLVQQIQELIITIGGSMNISCHACFGGNRVRDDIKALEDIRPQMVVGTPNRIQFMIQRSTLLTESIKMFVLDEADKMLVVGFTESVYDVFPLLPRGTQVVLLSATMPEDVSELTTKFMRDPIQISDHYGELEGFCHASPWPV
jgi:superfamily II DNA/RNA helicase